jgi:AraC-like DNA-binding protein
VCCRRQRKLNLRGDTNQQLSDELARVTGWRSIRGLSGQALMDWRVQQALRLISADLRRPLLLEEIARAVNLSPPHLRYLFKMALLHK